LSRKRTFQRAAFRAAVRLSDRLGVNALLRRKRRRTPVALMYHGVTDGQRMDSPRRGHVTVGEFDAQLSMLKRHFTIVSSAELREAILQASGPARGLLTITFDDGYENNLLAAAPVLRSHGLAACFFISTGRVLSGRPMVHDLLELSTLYGSAEPAGPIELDGRDIPVRLGDDRERKDTYERIHRRIVQQPWRTYERIVTDLYRRVGSPEPPEEYRQQYAPLREEQVAELAALGMEVGSHTVHHVALSECDDERILEELTTAAAHIKQWTGRSASEQALSYPLGKYDDRVIRMAREVGHPMAYAVGSGKAPTADHLYELPRINLGRGLSLPEVSGLVSGLDAGVRKLVRFGRSP